VSSQNKKRSQMLCKGAKKRSRSEEKGLRFIGRHSKEKGHVVETQRGKGINKHSTIRGGKGQKNDVAKSSKQSKSGEGTRGRRDARRCIKKKNQGGVTFRASLRARRGKTSPKVSYLERKVGKNFWKLRGKRCCSSRRDPFFASGRRADYRSLRKRKKAVVTLRP